MCAAQAHRRPSPDAAQRARAVRRRRDGSHDSRSADRATSSTPAPTPSRSSRRSSGDARGRRCVRDRRARDTRVAVMACAPTRPTDLKWPNLRTILAAAGRASSSRSSGPPTRTVRRSRATWFVGTWLRATCHALRPCSARRSLCPGVVRHGDARGRTIGFPTANLPQDSADVVARVRGVWRVGCGRR